MIQHKPSDFPHEYLPSQHAWYASKWEEQHKVPADASNQAYDPERRVLIFTQDGEQRELPVLTPPPWVGKIRK